jgi:hypothetical protein
MIENLSEKMLKPQLWMLAINQDNGEMRIIELDKKVLNNEYTPDEYQSIPALAMGYLGYTENEQQSMEAVASLYTLFAAPSFYLFLEAYHENRPAKDQDYFLNIYTQNKNFLQEGASEKVMDLSSDEDGAVFDGEIMIAEFTDPKLAHWACLAANLYNELEDFTLSKNLRALGFGNVLSFGNQPSEMGQGFVKKTAIESTKKKYEELKSLLPELSWSLEDNIKKLMTE